MSAIVVHELQQGIEPDADIALVVYCRYDDPQCQNITNIAGDLLKQCIRGRQLPSALAELFQQHQSSDATRPPAHDAMFSLLSDQLASYRKCYIVIDALDEISNSDNRQLLIQSLRSIRTNLSVMIMSRELEEVESIVGLTDHVCDCCTLYECTHCGEYPRYAEYLYNCEMCKMEFEKNGGNFPGGFDLCQACYQSHVRCPGNDHGPMERMLNCISYNIAPDEDDVKRYLHWRVASDSSLKMLMEKRPGLQDLVCDAVVMSSGSMSVDTLIAGLKVSDGMQVPNGEGSYR